MSRYEVGIVSRISVQTFFFCFGLLVLVFSASGEVLCLEFWGFFVVFLLISSLMISFVGCRTLWLASREIFFLSLVRDDDVGWLLLFGERLLSHVRCSTIAVGLHLLRSLGRWNIECVSFEQTMISSSWGLFFPLSGMLWLLFQIETPTILL